MELMQVRRTMHTPLELPDGTTVRPGEDMPPMEVVALILATQTASHQIGTGVLARQP